MPVAEGAWDRTFKPGFEFDIADTINKHDVFIDVRHTGEYPFSDLFLFVDLEGPGGRTVRDTVECLLADPDRAVVWERASASSSPTGTKPMYCTS